MYRYVRCVYVGDLQKGDFSGNDTGYSSNLCCLWKQIKFKQTRTCLLESLGCCDQHWQRCITPDFDEVAKIYFDRD
jgi:hypothetical protein